MFANKLLFRIFSAWLVSVITLAACSLGSLFGGSKLAGRWVMYFNDEHTAGNVVELHTDGTGGLYTFNDLERFEYPPMINLFTYTYDAKSGLLVMDPVESMGEQYNSSGFITFVSDDEITIDDKRTEKVEDWVYLRTPVPELPLGARSRLGKLLLPEDTSLVSAEKLEKDWQDLYPGYTVAIPLEVTPAEDPEQWALVIQRGEEQVLFILVEGESIYWGAIRLEQGE